MKYINELVINESYIYLTDRFKNIIGQIPSKISLNINSVDRKDIKPDMTFIDISDKEGYVTFSQSGNIVKKISDILDFSFNKDSMALTNADINHVMKNGEIFKKSRNEIKLGRFINTLFPNEYSSKDIEEYVNVFKSVVKRNDFKFKIVKGKEIVKYYNQYNYLNDRGTLGSSCMRYSWCSNYFDIYTKNDRICSLLILVNDDDKLLGRALLWNDFKFISDIENDIEIPDITPKLIMDRIYYSEDYIKYLFIEWANNNNSMYRYSDIYESNNKFVYLNNEYKTLIKIELDRNGFDYYPYMDTFRVIYGDSIFNKLDASYEDGESSLTDTNGNMISGIWSEYDQRYYDEDDCVYSEAYDSYISYEECVYIESECDYYPGDSDLIVYDEYNDEHILVDNSDYSEIGDYYYSKKDNCYAIIKTIPIDNLKNIKDYTSNFSDMDGSIRSIDKLLCYNFMEKVLEDKMGIEYLHFLNDSDVFMYNTYYNLYTFRDQLFDVEVIYGKEYSIIKTPWRDLISYKYNENDKYFKTTIDIYSISKFFNIDDELNEIYKYTKISKDINNKDLNHWVDILKKLKSYLD